MCLTDFLDDGGIIQTPQNQTEWGQHPRMDWLRFRTRAFLMGLTQDFPDLAFSISLSWVDLEQTWRPRTGSSAAGGPECRST